MKAVAYRTPGPIDRPDALIDLDLPAPQPGPRDLLVRVRAISVNPVDAKVRASAQPAADLPSGARVLGWDAVGTVEAVGAQAQGFAVGDRVWYAGAIQRPGANSELHAVDARIVSHAPASLSDAQAAALPLTAITAWELLFDRLGVPLTAQRDGGQGQRLLIVGGAGGVGSILIQLARRLTGLQVIATASRAETRDWCLQLGAHSVIDHRQPLADALKAAGFDGVDLVASLTHTDKHYPQIVQALHPQGKLALIDDPATLDAVPLKSKALSLHWEFMFARPLYDTPDVAEQGRLLAEVARLADAGQIQSTMTEHFGTINAANLKKAHAFVEGGAARGKGVLEGFGA